MRAMKKVIDMFRFYFRGRIGDAAVLKLDLYGLEPSDACVERVTGMGESVPRFSIDELRRMPEGTLGREYARFCDRFGITPIDISDEVRATIGGKDFPIRYMVVHDLIHTILGFDATILGELGVYAFTVEQGYFRRGREMLRLSEVLYGVFTPWRARAVRQAIARGKELGRRAAYLISEPLETMLARPLDEVRQHYGIA